MQCLTSLYPLYTELGEEDFFLIFTYKGMGVFRVEVIDSEDTEIEYRIIRRIPRSPLIFQDKTWGKRWKFLCYANGSVFDNGSLLIPNAFLGRFRAIIPGSTKIRLVNGEQLDCQFNSNEGKLSGLLLIVEKKYIENWDILIFTYRGSGEFDLSLYDNSRMEKLLQINVVDIGQNEEGQLNSNNVIIPDAPGHDGIQFSKCLALSNIDGTSHGVHIPVHVKPTNRAWIAGEKVSLRTAAGAWNVGIVLSGRKARDFLWLFAIVTQSKTWENNWILTVDGVSDYNMLYNPINGRIEQTEFIMNDLNIKWFNPIILTLDSIYRYKIMVFSPSRIEVTNQSRSKGVKTHKSDNLSFEEKLCINNRAIALSNLSYVKDGQKPVFIHIRSSHLSDKVVELDFGTVLYERFKAGTMCNQLILELRQMQFDLSVVYLDGTLILVNGWKKFVYLAAVKEGEILAVKYVPEPMKLMVCVVSNEEIDVLRRDKGDIGPSRSHRRDEIHQAADRAVEPHSSICSRIATADSKSNNCRYILNITENTFEVVLKPSHLDERSHGAYVNRNLAMFYKKWGKTPTATVSTVAGTWRIRMNIDKKKCRFGKGWNEFVSGAKLKEGKKLKSSLVEPEEKKFTVEVED
ncbi:hypothetical protein DCAR_0623515 [Daucus carota subsp. sativus]|uniref:TF-B3 domain-containing protein n=1 Tax=Daucus carota subsp. sativus TaxID=79200 RepID=A0A164V933_DAUCS|nr:hypothetical protein DCAR_0623515 [Daucus carota subsp. sativus]